MDLSDALILAVLALATGLVGCLGGAGPGGQAPPAGGGDRAGGSSAAPGFGTPVQLDGAAFEPSIEVGPEGAIYITAPSPAENGSRVPSWLWLSRDGGETWTAPAGHPIEPPPDPRIGFMEGDVAVDPRGWLYQVDTYFTDNTVGAWSDTGRTLEHARAAQGTPVRDDRPWIAAAGNGTLVYVGNELISLGPEGVYRSPRQYIYRSADAGRSWVPVDAVPEATGLGWALLDAHAPSGRVAVAQVTGDEPPAEVRVMVSQDAGLTFSDPRTVAELEAPKGPQAYPAVAVGPTAIYVAWNERLGEDPQSPTQLRLARSTDDGETWTTASIGDGERAFAFPWVSVGSAGQLGPSVYEARPAPAGPGPNWSVVAGIEPQPASGTLAPSLAPADPAPVSTAPTPEPLGDFHQNTFGPDGRLHIAYTADREGESYVRWVAGQPP